VKTKIPGLQVPSDWNGQLKTQRMVFMKIAQHPELKKPHRPGKNNSNGVQDL